MIIALCIFFYVCLLILFAGPNNDLPILLVVLGGIFWIFLILSYLI